jgi:hypothetical protein
MRMTEHEIQTIREQGRGNGHVQSYEAIDDHGQMAAY